MPDGDEQAGELMLCHCVRLQIFDPHPRHPGIVSQNLLNGGVPEKPDFLMLERPLLHDLARPESVPTVKHCHAAAEVGEVEGFLHRRIPTTHDGDILIAEEKTITGRARRDAASIKLLLGLQPKPSRRSYGGDDEGFTGQRLLIGLLQPKRPLGQIDGNHIAIDKLGVEAPSLRHELVHHLRTLHSLRIARIVLHIGGDHQLPTRFVAGNQHRTQVSPRCVNGSGQPGRAGTKNDHTVMPSTHVKVSAETMPTQRSSFTQKETPYC